jgi:REP element-mobilizing transposase RayT
MENSAPKRFHRKSLDHKVHPAGWFGATYFITICCARKGRNQLCHPKIAKGIFKTAQIYDERRSWYLHLLLLMPDHVHALISLDGASSLSVTIASVKRATAKFTDVKWQRNFFDHRLRHDESFMEKANYIRGNPVRAGLTVMAADWPYVFDRSHIEMAVR